MKKNIFILSLFFALALIFNFFAASFVPHASAACNDANQLCNPIAASTVPALLVTVINFMLSILGLLAVIFVIWGGFQYVTSAGNEENAKKARKTITYALLGLALAILSYSIVRITANTLTTGAGINNNTTNPAPNPNPNPNPTPNPNPNNPPPPPTACAANAGGSVSIEATVSTVQFGQSVTIIPTLQNGVPANCKDYKIDIVAINADGTSKATIMTGAGSDGDTINVPITNAIFKTASSLSNFTLQINYTSTASDTFGLIFAKGTTEIAVQPGPK